MTELVVDISVSLFRYLFFLLCSILFRLFPSITQSFILFQIGLQPFKHLPLGGSNGRIEIGFPYDGTLAECGKEKGNI